MSREYGKVIKQIADDSSYKQLCQNPTDRASHAGSLGLKIYFAKLTIALNLDARKILGLPQSRHNPVGDLVAVCFETLERREEIKALRDEFISDLRKSLPALYELAKTTKGSPVGEVIRTAETENKQ